MTSPIDLAPASARAPATKRPDEFPSPPRRASFRRDIQALRAVAVTAVVLYHLWPAQFPGGFTGVDVFFVISGFLITSHLADELARTGRISLTRFWARRIRRLLPAAFAVLLTCVGILVLLMPPITWANNLEELRAAALYSENWLLAAHAVDYLAAENSPSLVQHYWSLSAEEQFYLFWPLLLLLAVPLTRCFAGASTRLAVLGVLTLAALGSFVVSVVLTASHPQLAFFATPARAWQFAVGGLVALAPWARRSDTSGAARGLATWAGLALLVYSTFAITSEDPFPGSVALIPVAGAALVLAGGTAATRRSPATLAGLRPVQWVGDNSYSIYLWHWPLIVAAPWVLHRPTPWPAKVAILAATLVLASLTKRYVEDPVRNGRAWHSRRWPAYAFAAAGMAGLLVVTTLPDVRVAPVAAPPAEEASVEAPASDTDATPRRSGGARKRPAHRVSCHGAAAMMPVNRCARPYAQPAGLDLVAAAADGRTHECLQGSDATTPDICTFGRKTTPKRTIAIVGNSHARRLVPALERYGQQRGWQVVVATRIDCMGLSTTPVGSQSADDDCVQWSGQLQQRLLSMPDLDAVIFASHIGAKTYLAGPDATPSEVRTAEEQVLASWSRFAARGIRVIVTEDVPGMRPDSGPECIARESERYDPCSRSRASVVGSNLMTRLARRNPQLVTYLPLSQFFCDAARCHSLIGGVVVYYDSHHVTSTYARSFAPYLGADLQAVLARPPKRGAAE
ncbi:MAG: acyltransferase [Actinomycetota bacterium]|nr:acyltransferase [Actinomycetota bacterium]